MSERFHVEPFESSESVAIEGPEARHIAKVMRMGPGDQVILFDGIGSECQATIQTVGKNSVLLTPEPWQAVCREASTRVVAAVALPKGDRLKFMVEKLTEIGVARLIPLDCQRASVKPRENTIAKMRRYVIEASKQCKRNVLMTIDDPVDVQQLVQAPPADSERFICLPEHSQDSIPDQDPIPALVDQLADSESLIEAWILVGPEGGFTNQENELAIATNWRAVNLGSRILRTETAIIASCVAALNWRPQ